MNKEKLKEKILKDDKEIYLSAQDYAKLSNDDKKQLKDILKEEGKDVDLYEEQMKKLWPKVFIPKPLKWRKK